MSVRGCLYTGCHRVDGSYLIIQVTADDDVGSSGGARVVAWDPVARRIREGCLLLGKLPSQPAHWRALCGRIRISDDGSSLVVPRFVSPTPPTGPVPVAARAAEVHRRLSSSANGEHVYSGVARVRGVLGAAPFVSMIRRPDGALGIFVQEPASGCTHTCLLSAEAAADALQRGGDGPAAAVAVYHGIVSRLTLSSDSVLFVVQPPAGAPPPPPSSAPSHPHVAMPQTGSSGASTPDAPRVATVPAPEVDDDAASCTESAGPARGASEARGPAWRRHREVGRIGALDAGGSGSRAVGRSRGAPRGTRPRSADHASRRLQLSSEHVPVHRGGGGAARPRSGGDRTRRHATAVEERVRGTPCGAMRHARPCSAEHAMAGSSGAAAARVYRRPRSADGPRSTSGAGRATVEAARVPSRAGVYATLGSTLDDAPRSRRPHPALQKRTHAAAAAAADAELASRVPMAPAAGAALCGVHGQMFFAPPFPLDSITPFFAACLVPTAAVSETEAVPQQQQQLPAPPPRHRRRPQSAAAAAQSRHAASWVARAGAVLADAAAGPLRALHARTIDAAVGVTAPVVVVRRPRVVTAGADVPTLGAAARPPTTRGLLRAFIASRAAGGGGSSGRPSASAPVLMPAFHAGGGGGGGTAHVPTVTVYRKLHGHGSLKRLRAPFPARDAAAPDAHQLLLPRGAVPRLLQRPIALLQSPLSTSSESLFPFEPPPPLPETARGRRWAPAAGDTAPPRATATTARGGGGGHAAPHRAAAAGDEDARMELETSRLRAKAALAVCVGEAAPLRVWERRRLGMSLIAAAAADQAQKRA